MEENDCCDSLNNFEKSHDDLGWVKQTGDNKIEQYFYVSNMKIYGGERSPVIYMNTAIGMTRVFGSLA